MKKFFIYLLLVSAFIFGGSSLVFAENSIVNCDSPDDPLGIGCGTASGLASTDIRFTVARVINATLGVLGTITLVLIVYAGFLWTTSAGNDDQIGKAKGILYGAVVGLVIIMSAYTISYFLLTQINSATNNSRTYTP